MLLENIAVNDGVLFENENWVVQEKSNELIITFFQDCHYQGELHISDKGVYNL